MSDPGELSETPSGRRPPRGQADRARGGGMRDSPDVFALLMDKGLAARGIRVCNAVLPVIRRAYAKYCV